MSNELKIWTYQIKQASKRACLMVLFGLIMVFGFCFQNNPADAQTFTYLPVTLTSPTNTSLLVTIKALDYTSGKWNYQVSWQRTLDRQGSIYISPKSDKSQILPLSIDGGNIARSGQFTVSTEPSTRFRLEFYTRPQAQGFLLLRKFFNTLPPPAEAAVTPTPTSIQFPSPTPTAVSTPAPTPTPTPTTSVDNYTAPQTNQYDVIVVGAGTGGVAAAVQASRMGDRVALLEETDWIGGQMTTSGVSTIDGTFYTGNLGIFKEFMGLVKSAYGSKPISTCYWSNSSQCFEPKIGQMALQKMLLSTSGTGYVKLFLRTSVASVIKNGQAVTGVVDASGVSYYAPVVIDATEYGDVIALSGASYRVGNSISGSINQSACIQDITYTAVVKKYPGGVPPELQLNTPPPGYNQNVASLFARIVATYGSRSGYPYDWVYHIAYRGLPDSSNPLNYTGASEDAPNITKTVINWANDYPSLYPYNIPPGAVNPTLSVKYLEDKSYRKQVDCEAKLKTLQFLYYMQHVLGQTNWSVANDEGYDTAYNSQENSCGNIPAEFKAIERNMPQRPYVRESRRIIGEKTMVAREIKRTAGGPAPVIYPTSIAVGDHGDDLHSCNQDANLETSLESKNDVGQDGPFVVPLEALIPEKIDGLIAAEKNISQTRLVNGATRLQPITMLTGQAAGALAALSVKEGVTPRHVPYSDVRGVLESFGDSVSIGGVIR